MISRRRERVTRVATDNIIFIRKEGGGGERVDGDVARIRDHPRRIA